MQHTPKITRKRRQEDKITNFAPNQSFNMHLVGGKSQKIHFQSYPSSKRCKGSSKGQEGWKKSSDGYGRRAVAHDERREASMQWEEGAMFPLFFSAYLYPLLDIHAIMLMKALKSILNWLQIPLAEWQAQDALTLSRISQTLWMLKRRTALITRSLTRS